MLTQASQDYEGNNSFALPQSTMLTSRLPRIRVGVQAGREQHFLSEPESDLAPQPSET